MVQPPLLLAAYFVLLTSRATLHYTVGPIILLLSSGINSLSGSITRGSFVYYHLLPCACRPRSLSMSSSHPPDGTPSESPPILDGPPYRPPRRTIRPKIASSGNEIHC